MIHWKKNCQRKYSQYIKNFTNQEAKDVHTKIKIGLRKSPKKCTSLMNYVGKQMNWYWNAYSKRDSHYRIGKDKRQFSIDEVSGEWVSSDTAWKDRHLCTLSWSGLTINIKTVTPTETFGSVISSQGFFSKESSWYIPRCVKSMFTAVWLRYSHWISIYGISVKSQQQWWR